MVVILTAVSPHLIALTIYVLTETPATFFCALLLALCVVARAEDETPRPAVMVLIGIVLGLLTLFRPIFIGFVPLMGLAVTRHRLEALLLVAAGVAVPVAPSLIRNLLARTVSSPRRARSP